jgi:hypothetical protein
MHSCRSPRSLGRYKHWSRKDQEAWRSGKYTEASWERKPLVSYDLLGTAEKKSQGQCTASYCRWTEKKPGVLLGVCLYIWAGHPQDLRHQGGVYKSVLTGQVLKLGMVVHTYNPSSQEAEGGESSVQGQPGLLSETLSNVPLSLQKRLGPRSFCSVSKHAVLALDTMFYFFKRSLQNFTGLLSSY